MQSGLSASSASTSFVAATPSVRPRPASSPASLPTLSGLETKTPTSSRSGRASMPARAWLPTFPVLHCTTRWGMAAASFLTGGSRAARRGALEVRDRELEVGRLQPAVDFDDLAGDVGPAGETNQRMAAAMSSTTPIRLSGVTSSIEVRSSSLDMTMSRAEVAVEPTPMAFTLIRGARSREARRVYCSTAPFTVP